MRHSLHRWFALLVLTASALTALRTGSLAAQEPTPQLAKDAPSAYVLPPVTDPPIPVHLRPDPLLERPDADPVGYFFNAEATFDFVHLRNQPSIPVTISPTRTVVVQFPGNRLDDTVMPRLEAGYRLPDGLGAFLVSYRFLTTQGSDIFTGALGPASQQGRLDLNVADFTYVSQEFSLEPNWDMRWFVGGRYAFTYFDSGVNYLNPGLAPGSILSQGESNSVWSLGPTVGLELDRKMTIPGLTAFGRLEGSSMFGRIKQQASELVTPGSTPSEFNLDRVQASVTIPTLGGTIGLSYALPGYSGSRIMLGYQYEVWWQVGRVNDSRATLEDQGVFLRAEFNY